MDSLLNSLSNKYDITFKTNSNAVKLLKKFNLPKELIKFYSEHEPSGKLSEWQPDLLSIREIVKENKDISPGYIVSQFGFVVFAVSDGDVICFDLNLLMKQKTPRIVLFAHDEIDETMEFEEINELAKPIARNLNDFLKKLLNKKIDLNPLRKKADKKKIVRSKKNDLNLISSMDDLIKYSADKNTRRRKHKLQVFKKINKSKKVDKILEQIPNLPEAFRECISQLETHKVNLCDINLSLNKGRSFLEGFIQVNLKHISKAEKCYLEKKNIVIIGEVKLIEDIGMEYLGLVCKKTNEKKSIYKEGSIITFTMDAMYQTLLCDDYLAFLLILANLELHFTNWKSKPQTKVSQKDALQVRKQIVSKLSHSRYFKSIEQEIVPIDYNYLLL